MSEAPSPDDRIRISDAERHEVAELLREAAGQGRLELEELEELDERLEATYAARTRADLVPLTEDLPTASLDQRPRAVTPVPRSSAVPTRPAEPARHFAVMSGFERSGRWTVPVEMTVTAVMGGAELDLREATFAAREVVLTLNAVMGGVNVVVPPWVEVVMEGTGIAGGFAGPTREVPAELSDDSPVLRVRGVAVMGGVGVTRKHAPPAVQPPESPPQLP